MGKYKTTFIVSNEHNIVLIEKRSSREITDNNNNNIEYKKTTHNKMFCFP